MAETPDQIDLTRKLLELGQQIVSLAQEVSNSSIRPTDPTSESSMPTRSFLFGELARTASDLRADEGSLIKRQVRPPLPDPRLIRNILRQRRLRSQYFDDGLFADPAWDILLDLTAARAEHERVSVTSACIASGVPSTTALRWIQQLLEVGLLDRTEDDRDRRRAFISLSDSAAERMARYFEHLGASARLLT
ncbi:hypothetical protein [Novosphingobium sp.]|uniref:hypothetical protein n=1 Tax=Novosphingobium sp. TaxID=1874826 RepID=UPI003433F1D9|nr:winged helix DNA-binding protein [Novosphingobium sp.]